MSTPKEYGEGFLYADDLVKDGVWAEFHVTIAEVIPAGTIKCGNGQMINDKLTLRYEKAKKLHVIPVTVKRLIRFMHGEPKGWPGCEITLYPAFGRTPQGEAPFIRVRPNCAVQDLAIGIRKFLGEDLTGRDVTGQNRNES